MMHTNIRISRLAIATVVGVASIAAMWAWAWRVSPVKASLQQSPSVSQLEMVESVAPSSTPKERPVEGGATKESSAIDYRKALAESHNYWVYAHTVLPAAMAGNADAQFYLSKVLESCDEDNRMYFQRRGQKIGLDEGLQYAVKRHLSIDVAQSVYEKCHDFQDHDSEGLGTANDWLAKATAAGQPLAQTTTALKLLVQDALQNSARAAGVPNPNVNSRIADQSDPRSLLRSAVESRAPEVLFDIGAAQGILYPGNGDAHVRGFAWMLVACQHGLDCSANADWVKNSCGDNADCISASSSSDRIRKIVGNLWPDVQQSAEDINAKLDAGRWDELDLGPKDP